LLSGADKIRLGAQLLRRRQAHPACWHGFSLSPRGVCGQCGDGWRGLCDPRAF
jgi:hypothetical protein